MKTRPDSKVWAVEIIFEEDPDRTDATALLHEGGLDLGGWGRARRNPDDPWIASVGEQLAAARAMSDLAHKLIRTAADAVAEREGHPVEIHG
jgi:hypothetical protein